MQLSTGHSQGAKYDWPTICNTDVVVIISCMFLIFSVILSLIILVYHYPILPMIKSSENVMYIMFLSFGVT